MIRLKDAEKTYENGTKAVRGISFQIDDGEFVFLVGPSGSGKSTLAGCINGLNPFSNPGACTGTLTVDGVDAPHSSIFELSAHVGTVLQDPDGQFIGLTVGEDIAFALENSCVPQKEMHEITRHAAELVGIEKRLDYAPHELSGGQKQRLSIARVFLKNPPILIFDEATSALDNESEKVVQESLEKLAKNRTTLVIAHRLSTIRNAERILVLTENGIAESGNHEELLAKNGIYAELYNMQFRK